MGAKWDIDEVLMVPAKVTQVTTDDTGTVYQVKVISNDKAVSMFFKEDELEEPTVSA